jgi:hypothetical protein
MSLSMSILAMRYMAVPYTAVMGYVSSFNCDNDDDFDGIIETRNLSHWSVVCVAYNVWMSEMR